MSRRCNSCANWRYKIDDDIMVLTKGYYLCEAIGIRLESSIRRIVCEQNGYYEPKKKKV